MKALHTMSQATDRLAAAVQANADAVNQLIAKATTPAPENTDDAVNAAAQAIEDETARVNAALTA